MDLFEDVKIGKKQVKRDEELSKSVSEILKIAPTVAATFVASADRLYKDKMTKRFTDLRFKERLKRTNPFLVQVRGLKTVRQWAETQVTSALYASEEEAVGHLLEMIAKSCHPKARNPQFPTDLDFEVATSKSVRGYQIKMSWDCMPMSSRKNLSNTILRLSEHYRASGITFEGIFAPCYGSPTTRNIPSQAYTTIRSRDFWMEVGNGDEDYDTKVGEVCRMLCSEFRSDLYAKLIPDLVERLTVEGCKVFGDETGNIDYTKLFREINR